MKGYIKGIITGFLISMAVFAIPVVAENIDALFNQVRINVNGVDEIQWGENIELDNGETTPSSILYNGTTYLPMRKLGELSGNKIYWNGDSRTVSMTGTQKDIEVIAEKPDKNGHVWTYYTFEDDKHSYLGVKDETRGYERVYEIASNVHVKDDAIYFFGRVEPDSYQGTAALIKISFNNDIDTQDGEEIFRTDTLGSFVRAHIIDDEYLYIIQKRTSNGATTRIQIYNYQTDGFIAFDDGAAGNATYASVYDAESTETEVVLKYAICRDGQVGECYKIVFDKITKTLGQRQKIEKEVEEILNW